jgi:OFA family oxalate/formate antiporter-like MFS transporter
MGGGLVNVAIGTYYAWSVFVPALEKDFGWNRAQTSWVPTINMVTLALSFVTAGFLQRRIGPRAVATIGGLVYSLGLLLASFIHTLWDAASDISRRSRSVRSGFRTTAVW